MIACRLAPRSAPFRPRSDDFPQRYGGFCGRRAPKLGVLDLNSGSLAPRCDVSQTRRQSEVQNYRALAVGDLATRSGDLPRQYSSFYGCPCAENRRSRLEIFSRRAVSRARRYWDILCGGVLVVGDLPLPPGDFRRRYCGFCGCVRQKLTFLT